jgi:hypothetical protein
VRQSYSHFRLEGEVLRVETLPEVLADAVAYFSPEAIGELPLGGVDRKVLEVYIR